MWHFLLFSTVNRNTFCTHIYMETGTHTHKIKDKVKLKNKDFCFHKKLMSLYVSSFWVMGKPRCCVSEHLFWEWGQSFLLLLGTVSPTQLHKQCLLLLLISCFFWGNYNYAIFLFPLLAYTLFCSLSNWGPLIYQLLVYARKIQATHCV